ncbi:oligosaccharide flippase family protein [Edwardsiella tarda]|uniref:oligosaccharide flippase family protein n=1 Tax=Edwardsiella tarda TaxID=636 RepID=UPI003A87FC62
MITILKNGLSLSFIRIVTLLFPIVIVPILISRIGMDKYGEVVFFTAIYSYFITVVSFGFEESATQTLAKDHFYRLTRSEYVLSVIALKAIIAIIFIIIILLLLFFGYCSHFFALFSITIVAEVLNPLWFYQGVEKIHIVSISSIISKVLYGIAIFVFIKSPTDYYLIPVSIGVSGIISYIYPFFLIFNECGFNREALKYKNLRFVFIDSYSIFLTNFIPTIKDKIGAILIGSSFAMSIVAIYDIIMKVLNLLFIPLNVMNSSFYPTLSRLRSRKTLIVLSLLSIIYASLSFFLFYFCLDFFVGCFFNSYLEYVSAIKIVSLSVVFYSGSLLIGKNILLVAGFYNYVLISIVLSTSFYLLSVFILHVFGMLNIYSLCALTTMSFLFEMLVRILFLKRSNALSFFPLN